MGEATRVHLIVNPVASSVTARKRVIIRKALAADHDVTLAETEHRGHARELAEIAAADGADVVVVLGGDGTLNEAANGLLGTSTALAPLPGGSTNVYARALGLPDDSRDATAEILAALDHRAFRRIGVGEANGRAFLFHCGIGFDAAVIRQVEKRHALKRYMGHPLFVATAFDTWFRHRTAWKNRVTIRTDEETIDDVGLAIVSKVSPYTYLGTRPIVVAPGAELDSALSLTAFTRTDPFTLLGSVASALRTGRWFHRRRGVVHRSNLTEMHVTAGGVRAPAGRHLGDFPWQLDGDDMGNVAALTLRYLPDALNLIDLQGR